MLAGDLFDTPKVLRRLRLFKLVYAIVGLRDWRRWRSEHNTGSRRRARNSPAATRRWIKSNPRTSECHQFVHMRHVPMQCHVPVRPKSR